MHRTETNLRFWRELVGLPPNFPELPRLGDDEILDLMVIDPEIELELQNALSSKRLTAAIAQDGCGLTTLYHYVLQRCQLTTTDRLVIPVSIDLEEPDWQKEITAAKLEDEIKFQVIANLVSHSWIQKLDRAHYFYCVNYEEDRDFFAFQLEMRKLIFEKKLTRKNLQRAFPFTEKPLVEFINYLLKNLRIQTALLIHFPREIAPQLLQDLITAVKYPEEGSAFEPAAFREFYFLTPTMLTGLKTTYARNYHEVDYPGYTPAQIVAMLVKRYKPFVPGAKGTKEYRELGSVFDQRFVHLAWVEDRPLAEVITKIKDLILERLDCEKKDISFRLEPTAEQEKAHEAEKAKVVDAPPPKKRFTRQREV